MYCAGKTSACLKRRFASSVLHSCNVNTQICVTRPQCVKSTPHCFLQENLHIEGLWSNIIKDFVLSLHCR